MTFDISIPYVGQIIEIYSVGFGIMVLFVDEVGFFDAHKSWCLDRNSSIMWRYAYGDTRCSSAADYNDR